VDVGAGVAGLLLGLAVGPVADRVATNAPARLPLLAATPASRRVLHVTAATALLGAVCGLAFGFSFEAAIACAFCWLLVVVTRTDLEHRLIPNRIVIPGAVVVLAARTIDDPGVGWALGALGAGLVLFVLALVYPGGLGMGDVKLAVLLGAGLGLAVIVALLAGFAAAFVPALTLLIRHGPAARKRTIPLGPFLALGGVVALFAGDQILDWYVGLGS
jgi:leader peptidase (prepilin peptidase) / N-methyltransferase